MKKMKFVSSEEAARLLEGGSPAEAVELLSQFGLRFGGYHLAADSSVSQVLELVNQDRLHEMWSLGPEARRKMVLKSSSGSWLSRVADDDLRIVFRSVEEDYDVLLCVCWHIVYASRAALYPELLEQSDLIRWDLIWSLDQIDKRLAKGLARQSLKRIQAGQSVEKELKFLLHYSGLPFGQLDTSLSSDGEQVWLAEHYPIEVARVVGYHVGMEVSSPEEAMDIIHRAGFDMVDYDVRGEASTKQVLAFNRQVCEADDEVPDSSLLIKEGFGWRIESAELWPSYTTGGLDFTNPGSEEPEYEVTVAIEPRKWLYRSRSGRSVITFERREDGKWEFEGRVSLNSLQDLVGVGIEPTIYFGPFEIAATSLIDAAAIDINSSRVG